MSVKGILSAVVTPFTDRGDIDFPAYKQLLTVLVKKGVNGLFISGNAGEYYALSLEEKKQLLKVACETVQGAVPVYFGSGASSTAETVSLTQLAEKGGADAVSVITPSACRPSQEDLYVHYKTIAGSTSLPVLIYNNPAATGVSVSPGLMKRLSEIDNIVGVKDSSGDFMVTLDFISIAPGRLHVLAGRDGLILPTLMQGGTGAISSVASAVPELAVSIYENYKAGNMERAVESQKQFASLRSLFSLGTFPSVVKAALKLRGLDVGAPRLPVLALAEDKVKVLERKLHEILGEYILL